MSTFFTNETEIWEWLGDHEVWFPNSHGENADISDASPESMKSAFDYFKFQQGYLFCRLKENVTHGKGIWDPLDRMCSMAGTDIERKKQLAVVDEGDKSPTRVSNYVVLYMTHHNNGKLVDAVEPYCYIPQKWVDNHLLDLDFRDNVQRQWLIEDYQVEPLENRAKTFFKRGKAIMSKLIPKYLKAGAPAGVVVGMIAVVVYFMSRGK